MTTFAVAVQVNNPVGDPEDFSRTQVTNASMTVNWSLPETTKTFSATAQMSLAGAPRLGAVLSLVGNGGAALEAAAALGKRLDGVFSGSAAITGSVRASIAAPAVTPDWRTIAVTDRGARTVTITQPGSNEGEI